MWPVSQAAERPAVDPRIIETSDDDSLVPDFSSTRPSYIYIKPTLTTGLHEEST